MAPPESGGSAGPATTAAATARMAPTVRAVRRTPALERGSDSMRQSRRSSRHPAEPAATKATDPPHQGGSPGRLMTDGPGVTLAGPAAFEADRARAVRPPHGKGCAL